MEINQNNFPQVQSDCIPPFPWQSLNNSIHLLIPRWLSTSKKENHQDWGDGWGIISCLSEDDSQKSHTSSSISNQKQWAVRLARVFSVPDLPKELILNILSRKVQVPNLKGNIFTCGPFCRFYKRSASTTRWSDHQVLTVLEVADFDFWVAGSNSLSVHCHLPLPSPESLIC